jgi:hypothetical protein
MAKIAPPAAPVTALPAIAPIAAPAIQFLYIFNEITVSTC